MKIFYLQGKYPFCYYYRGYLPAIYSNQKCTPEFLKTENINQERFARNIHEADVVVMQRPQSVERLNLLRSLKREGKKVIFENDDTYLAGKGILLERLQNDAQRKLAVEISDMTNQILYESDAAIASTPFLAKEFTAYNKNVAVLKNCIDPLDAYVSKKNLSDKFRVGLIGSVTTNDDYVHIKDDLRKLDERGDVTIVIMGIRYADGSVIPFMKEDEDFWKSLKNVEWHHYVPVLSYMHAVSKLALDLAIIPRQDSYFNRAKSNLKFLEMSLLKIPVLAQNFEGSPYLQDEPHVSLVDAGKSWYYSVLEVMENHDEYVTKASKAHDYVLENYNIHSYAEEWTKTISNLI